MSSGGCSSRIILAWRDTCTSPRGNAQQDILLMHCRTVLDNYVHGIADVLHVLHGDHEVLAHPGFASLQNISNSLTNCGFAASTPPPPPGPHDTYSTTFLRGTPAAGQIIIPRPPPHFRLVGYPSSAKNSCK
jgi:hypothetical protein